MTHSEQETYRSTLAAATPEGHLSTLIVTRQGHGQAARTWLTFHGAIKTTVELTKDQAARLREQLGEASGGEQ